jgi:hypothetical protein
MSNGRGCNPPAIFVWKPKKQTNLAQTSPLLQRCNRPHPNLFTYLIEHQLLRLTIPSFPLEYFPKVKEISII